MAVLSLNTMQWVRRSQPKIWRKIPWTPRTLAFWMYVKNVKRETSVTVHAPPFKKILCWEKMRNTIV